MSDTRQILLSKQIHAFHPHVPMIKHNLGGLTPHFMLSLSVCVYIACNQDLSNIPGICQQFVQLSYPMHLTKISLAFACTYLRARVEHNIMVHHHHHQLGARSHSCVLDDDDDVYNVDTKDLNQLQILSNFVCVCLCRYDKGHRCHMQSRTTLAQNELKFVHRLRIKV